jgi:hypothetical protein
MGIGAGARLFRIESKRESSAATKTWAARRSTFIVISTGTLGLQTTTRLSGVRPSRLPSDGIVRKKCEQCPIHRLSRRT